MYAVKRSSKLTPKRGKYITHILKIKQYKVYNIYYFGSITTYFR